ncbi:isoprenoid biosynthesis glyoxalase ElbB [Sessilibacter sp. MAH1]
MSKKVAVVLSGCGVFDGAEIYESVFTLLRLNEAGARIEAFAPDIKQLHVVNHLSGEVAKGETRNVLVEAARIMRGDIQPLSEAKVEDFDALIVPGGFGAAKNLCDFAVNGVGLQVNEEFLAFAKRFHEAGKPIGLICISPVMAAAICGAGVKCTIGRDLDTAKAIAELGGDHQDCGAREFTYDENNKLATTPAYMLAENMIEAKEGIDKLVDKILEVA